MTHSIPFSLLRDGPRQLFNSHIAMLQCFRAEKKNPASSLSCREYLGKGNVIIRIGSGPGLRALGKEAFRTSTFQPTLKMGCFHQSGASACFLLTWEKAPGHCLLHTFPFPGSLGVSFPETGPDSAGERGQRPRELPFPHQFGFNI